jgi:uncharacterized membrane protein
MEPAETAIPNAAHKPLGDRILWTVGVAAILTTALYAFWFSLGYYYSPENYLVALVAVSTAGLAWFVAGTLAAIILVVNASRDAASCRRTLRALIPLAVAGAIIVGKVILGRRLQFLDALLLSLACGLSVSFGTRGWKYLSGEDSRWLAVIVWSGVAAVGAYFVWQQIHYLSNLALGYHDCGNEARTMYNTLYNPRELFLSPNPDYPIFCDHFRPGVLPFVPFWLLAPRVEVTILFQVAATIGVVAPLYGMARERWADTVAALLLVAGWLAYPSVSLLTYNASYGFNWGQLCLPLYFTALWLWLRGRNGWALAAIVWAVLINEEAAVYLGMFGLYLAFFHRQRRIGVALAIGGFAYFWLMTTLVIPAFDGHGYRELAYFSGLGTRHLEILLSPLTKPKQFWGRLFEMPSFYLLGCLLVPLLLLPLRRPKVLFIGSIPFLFICLWNNPNVKSICFWYQVGLLPVLFLALIEALRDGTSEATKVTRRATVLGIVAAGTTLSIYCGNTFWSKDGLVTQLAPGRLALVERLGARIDPHGTPVATERLAAHFVTQRYLYILPKLPAQTDYVFMDFRDNWRRAVDAGRLRELRAFQRRVEAQPALKLLAVEDGLALYGRGGNRLDAPRLVECDSLPPDALNETLPLGHGVVLAGYTVTALPPAVGLRGHRLRVRTFGTVSQHVDVDLAVRAVLTFGSDQSKVVVASPLQLLGQCIWPTYRWEPGRFYMDDFTVDVPESLSGQSYTVGFAAERLDGELRLTDDNEAVPTGWDRQRASMVNRS